MKKLLLMLLVGLFGGLLNISAQLMIKEGNQWSYAHSFIYRVHGNTVTVYTFYKYEFDGTIELNGKTYMKLYETELDEYGRGKGPEYVLGLREENGRVYADYDEFMNLYGDFIDPEAKYYDSAMPYTVTEDGEVLLYDFTLNEGDYFGPTDIYAKTYIHGKTQKTMENGEVHDFFHVWRSYYEGFEDEDYDDSLWSEGGEYDTVISGIGSLECLIDWLFPRIYPTDGSMPKNWLNIFIADNELVYKSSDYVKDVFFDNLVTGISNVRSDTGHDVQPRLYDLSGRKVEGRPRPGVYIYNGKKVVIK